MIESNHLRLHVVRPVLQHLGNWSKDAEELILGTISQESAMGRYLVQLGSGPALGVCQMEPATHNDIWNNFLRYRSHIVTYINEISVDRTPEEMVWNLYYSVAMCRVHYLRVTEKIPSDLEGWAKYWKVFYNTRLGRGTEQEFIDNYQRYVR